METSELADLITNLLQEHLAEYPEDFGAAAKVESFNDAVALTWDKGCFVSIDGECFMVRIS